MSKFAIAAMLITLFGCASNPYSQFYTDLTYGRYHGEADGVFAPENQSPTIRNGGDINSDMTEMAENGYSAIGYSSFNAKAYEDWYALDQGRKIHADVVLIYRNYTNTVSGAIPWSSPTTQTSTTSFSGSYGGTNFNGLANTTTNGTQTTYIPYHVDRYDQFAAYYVKAPPPVLGLNVRDLSPEVRAKIQSNRGAEVWAVIKETPAFRADILKGDVVKKISDQEVEDVKSFMAAIQQYAGKKIKITLQRGDKLLTKTIQLRERAAVETRLPAGN